MSCFFRALISFFQNMNFYEQIFIEKFVSEPRVKVLALGVRQNFEYMTLSARSLEINGRNIKFSKNYHRTIAFSRNSLNKDISKEIT